MAEGLQNLVEGTGAAGLQTGAAESARVEADAGDSRVDLSAAADALRRGLPVVFPTDTVYGLGVSVRDAETPQVLYGIKGRDEGKPVAWLVGGAEALDEYGQDVPEAAYVLAERFWPGALTLIVRASDAVPEAFLPATGERTIALRMPAGETVLDLIRRVGCPLATTSANVSGRPAASVFSHIDAEISDQVEVRIAQDADVRGAGVASTIVDCTADPPAVVRQGELDVTAWL